MYFSNGRLKTVTDPQGRTTTYTYDAAGSRKGLVYPNSTTVSYAYDDNNRLTNLMHRNSVGDVLASYAYALGAIGNRTRIDEANGISRLYTYDRLYRLKSETVTDPTNVQTYQNDYAYDAIGNRQNKINTAYGQPTVSHDYTYNAADQLVSVNNTTYTYDLNGNLASKIDGTGTTTYAYNYDDRLVQVRTPNSELIAYTYDADGNRAGTATSTGTVKYLVDTNRSLPQVLAEYTTAGAVIASYVYADDLVSMNRGGAIFCYHFDGLGSTRLLTDAAGTITDTYEYDAFGNQIARTGTTQNEFLFTGQQYDANLGYYYLRARYYQPDTGRFTALDPYQGDPYTPASLHKYQYAANDPVNKFDPSGLESIGSLSVAIAITGILSSITISALWAFNLFNLLPPDAFGSDPDATIYGFNFVGVPSVYLARRGSGNPIAIGLAGALSLYQMYGGMDLVMSHRNPTNSAWLYWYTGGSIGYGITPDCLAQLDPLQASLYGGKAWNIQDRTSYEGQFWTISANLLPQNIRSRVSPFVTIFASRPTQGRRPVYGWLAGGNASRGGVGSALSLGHGKATYLDTIPY
jgi:RHS repeat-associated protein